MNRRGLIVVSSLVILLGGMLVLTTPGRVANKALEQAEQTYEAGQVALIELQAEFDAGSAWYAQTYQDTMEYELTNCQQLLDEASETLTQSRNAGRNKDKKALAQEAEQEMRTATVAFWQTRQLLEQFEASRQKASAQLSLAQDQFKTVTIRLNSTNEQFVVRQKRYLSKYVSLQQKRFDQVKGEVQKVLSITATVSSLLPSVESTAKLGDPDGALETLAGVDQLISSASTTLELISDDLELYELAEREASNAVKVCQPKIAIASNHLKNLVAKGPLRLDGALKAPTEAVAEAQQLYDKAVVALETVVEAGKYDRVFAYTSAQRGSQLSESAVADANYQLELYELAVKNGKRLQQTIVDSNRSLREAIPHLKPLQQHARETWFSVAANPVQAETLIQQAREALASAQQLVETSQLFEDALTELKRGSDALANANNLLASLVSTAERLEHYRTAWPDAEQEAKQAIDAEADYVSTYGDYSNEAQSDFDSALAKLKLANQAADQRHYEQAVQEAGEAAILVAGTGDEAYEAYRDYQRRQDDSSSSSVSFGLGNDGWDSDWSSSSSGGGFGGSDSGSWGGGSSGSDGGSWGGGSSGSDGGSW